MTQVGTLSTGDQLAGAVPAEISSGRDSLAAIWAGDRKCRWFIHAMIIMHAHIDEYDVSCIRIIRQSSERKRAGLL
jgi:hypothetical protein